MQERSEKDIGIWCAYLTFSIATWLLKTVFAENVNKQVDGLFSTLVVNPSAPYWYLYALFFIFLVTPTFSGVKAATVGLIVALVAKVLILTVGTALTQYRQFSQTKSGLYSV